MNNMDFKPLVTYREFRLKIIAHLGSNTRRNRSVYTCQPTHPLRQLRQVLNDYYDHLASCGESMLQADASVEPHLHRALRIPTSVRLLRSKKERVGQYLMRLLPLTLATRRAKKLLDSVGSFAGRRLVFAVLINRTFIHAHYYSRSFDFVMRKLVLPNSVEAFGAMRELDIGWMRAYLLLGIEQKVLMDRTHSDLRGNHSDGLRVLILVEQGVIQRAEELAWLEACPSWLMCHEQPLPGDGARFRRLVVLLMDAGVSALQITRQLDISLQRLKLDYLTENLTLLNCSGNELTTLFEEIAERVLFTAPQRWSFLLHVLNVRQACDLVRFDHLLASHKTCSTEFAQALVNMGCNIDGLVECQALILEVGEMTAPLPVIHRLSVLRGAPYSLSFKQVALAEGYLLRERDLPAYLCVLEQNGFASATAVLAFQCCYASLGAQMLKQWLNIAALPSKGHPLESVVEWLSKAAAGGHIDSFDYLQQSGELQTFTHLRQALKVAPLGGTLLRYLREERGLVGLSALVRWYAEDAPGIKEVRLWSGMDPVSRVLLDDGFERCDFMLMEGNKACVEPLLNQHADAVMGKYRYQAGEAERKAYDDQRRELREQLAGRLVPHLKNVLMLTEGLLLDSLMEHVNEPLTQLKHRVDRLLPQLSELREGGGPASSALTAEEAELVAMVYRTNVSTIKGLWTNVLGRESDVPSGLQLKEYPMSVLRTELQVEGDIDSRGLTALSTALAFASLFVAHIDQDAHEACRHLSPKRLKEKAADVSSLAQHLGVLLAICHADSNIAVWLEDAESRLATLAGVGPGFVLLLESLRALFDVDLGDALDAHCATFITRLGPGDVATLCRKLDDRCPANKGDDRAFLTEALSQTRTLVLTKYHKWVGEQRDLLIREGLTDTRSQMVARVSKAPAAFFAKAAAGICTKGNVHMWKESRHAHMLVFALGGKRIAGMALLYFERFQHLDKARDTLVIRAINPMDDVLSAHSVHSMVDSYFDAAIQIARDAGCTGVAFPAPSGMHLMSNRKSIEDDIEARFIARARPLHSADSDDAFGDWRDAPRVIVAHFDAYEKGALLVEKLYVIWRAQVPAESGCVEAPRRVSNG